MSTNERSMTTPRRRRNRAPGRRKSGFLNQRLGPVPVWSLAVGGLAVAAVVALAALNTLSGAGAGGGSNLRYAVGRPGVGEVAPDFALPSATGGTFQLSQQSGKNVLLYFHEGLGCAPCWKQIDDIQADLDKFQALGVDQVVAVSVDPLAAQAQRAQLRGVSIPVLADVGARASAAYDALSYGMMGGMSPGHTFILVGPDGKIRWRADYGGAPNYTMYVPDQTLLAELRTVLARAPQESAP